jgi:hypothetical protein
LEEKHHRDIAVDEALGRAVGVICIELRKAADDEKAQYE